MKYLIDVPEDKIDAFMKVMEGLRKGAVVQSIQVQKPDNTAESEKASKGHAASAEKTAYDFVEQYRDLVD